LDIRGIFLRAPIQYYEQTEVRVNGFRETECIYNVAVSSVHLGTMLFEEEPKFRGLPEDGFDVFGIRDRVERRREILDRIHPALTDLGEDLVRRLGPETDQALHAHLPRLDWPKGYQPFCTWLALSHEAQGYQAGPQLNVGVHADHVAVRLGWDASATEFGRFEFRCRFGHLTAPLLEAAKKEELKFRVFASAPWPVGSTVVFESDSDLAGSFSEVQRRGVWWEVGRRYDLPARMPLVTSPAFGDEAFAVFAALLRGGVFP